MSHIVVVIKEKSTNTALILQVKKQNSQSKGTGMWHINAEGQTLAP